MGIAPAMAAVAATSLFAGGRQVQRQQRREGRREARDKASAQKEAASLKTAEAKREAEISAASEEAKERARRRTVFAGADIEKNIFKRSLGGGAGARTTLGA